MKKSLILTGFLLVFIVPSAVSAASYRYYDDDDDYYYNRNRGSSYYDRYVSDRYLENERYWNNKYYSGSSRSTRTYKYIPVRENPRRYTDRAYRTSPYTIHPDYRYNECDTGTFTERYYDGEKWVEYERRGNCDDRYRSRGRTIRCTVNCDRDYDGYNRYYY